MSAIEWLDADGSLELSPKRLGDSIRTGASPGDEAFDRHLLPEVRAASHVYWTPLAVAIRAAAWLDEVGVQSVVDIGSGAGKFCVAAALAGRARFIGVEHRPRLVAAARDLARVFDVADRVRFVEGALGAQSVPVADAYYLYNPFEENVFLYSHRFDHEVELSEERFARDVAAAERLFEASPIGTYVLTYNGFGGCTPADYHVVRVDHTLPDVLRLWRKARTRDLSDADPQRNERSSLPSGR
jgi:SAM-dependent methyltransferase